MKKLVLLLTLLVFFFIGITHSLAQEPHWYFQNPVPTVTDINSVHVFDSDSFVAVGDDGLILKTTNAGLSWVTYDSGVDVDLYSVSFAGNNHGWASGSCSSTSSSSGTSCS